MRSSRQGQGHLSQDTYCEQSSVLVRRWSHIAWWLMLAELKKWGSLKIGEVPPRPHWKQRDPQISSLLKILHVSLVGSTGFGGIEGTLYLSLSKGNNVYKRFPSSHHPPLGTFILTTASSILVLMCPIFPTTASPSPRSSTFIPSNTVGPLTTDFCHLTEHLEYGCSHLDRC